MTATARGYDPRFPEHSFEEVMAEQLRHAPWMLLSVLIHAIAILLVLLIPTQNLTAQPKAVAMLPPEEDVVLEQPVEPPDEDPPPDCTELDPQLQDVDITDVADTPEVVEDFAPQDDSFQAQDWASIGLAGSPPRGGKSERRGLLRTKSPQTTLAIDRALKWLRRHQDQDGKWDADYFMKHDGDPPCDGPGNSANDVGVTGLALLAFLGDGSDLRRGADKDVVKKAVRWLRTQQDPGTGLFGSPTSGTFIYDHAIAALAMVEAYGLSESTILRDDAQRGLDYLAAHRNPYGVWRYQPRSGDDDTSITGWCLMAYKRGRDFGLQVDSRTFERCAVWLDQVTDPATGHCGYTERGELSSRLGGDHGVRFPAEKGEAMTAVGLMSRFFLGQDPAQHEVMRHAADRILRAPPTWDESAGTIDHYYWYYATYALYQMGGPHWKTWCKDLKTAVVDTLRSDVNAAGSWDPAGAWGDDGGRVYSTALLALTLEAYYRYARVFVR